ncbi:MAG: helix-turn-helix transcriptional regulator [Caulobacter sp.]|nr:helix-turn-helix transcriptional regulator [Caulobacter sp.]
MPGRLHDPDYAAMVEHLVATRKRLGTTQVELAACLGRPQSYVSKIERLERRIDVAEWRKIALALGQNPAAMFEEVCVLLEHIDLLAGPKRD